MRKKIEKKLPAHQHGDEVPSPSPGEHRSDAGGKILGVLGKAAEDGQRAGRGGERSLVGCERRGEGTGFRSCCFRRRRRRRRFRRRLSGPRRRGSATLRGIPPPHGARRPGSHRACNGLRVVAEGPDRGRGRGGERDGEAPVVAERGRGRRRCPHRRRETGTSRRGGRERDGEEVGAAHVVPHQAVEGEKPVSSPFPLLLFLLAFALAPAPAPAPAFNSLLEQRPQDRGQGAGPPRGGDEEVGGDHRERRGRPVRRPHASRREREGHCLLPSLRRLRLRLRLLRVRVRPGVEFLDEGVGAGPGRGADGAREGGEGGGRRVGRRAGGGGEESRRERGGAFVAAPFLRSSSSSSSSRRLFFLASLPL